MKYSTMATTALTLGLSLMVGAAVAADTAKYTEGFDNYTLDSLIGLYHTGYLDDGGYGWFSGSEDDASKVIAANGGQALQLNTEASTLTNAFDQATAAALNDQLATGSIYFESEVKFVPSDVLDAGVQGGTDDTKFAIYAFCPGDIEGATTNLVIYHAYYDENFEMNYTNDVTDILIDTSVYTKIRVEMKQIDDEGLMLNAFTVTVGNGDGAQIVTTGTAYDHDSGHGEGSLFLTAEKWSVTENQTVSALNLKGTGEIDNIVLGVIGGEEPPTSGYTFPEGGPIPADSSVNAWLVSINATQAQIDALGSNAALQQKYLLNLALADSSYELTVSSIAVGDTVDVAVTLTRTGALGAINGTLKLAGATALDGETGFAEVTGLEFSNGDFAEEGPAATSFEAGEAKFFKAVIE